MVDNTIIRCIIESTDSPLLNHGELWVWFIWVMNTPKKKRNVRFSPQQIDYVISRSDRGGQTDVCLSFCHDRFIGYGLHYHERYSPSHVAKSAYWKKILMKNSPFCGPLSSLSELWVADSSQNLGWIFHQCKVRGNLHGVDSPGNSYHGDPIPGYIHHS